MKKPKVSIVTPSVRPDRIALVDKSLSNQTYKNFEWLICGPEILRKKFEARIKHNKYTYLGNPPLKKGMYWDLNFSYNRMFKKARGELIVSLQDSIYIPPLGIKKFWEAYVDKGKRALFSGVGDQYDQLDEYGKPINKVWDDPRKTDKYGSFYECYPNDMEWNWAAFPRSAIFDIGGMDEKLDFLGFGGDQLQVCERWGEAGYNFWLDQTNESFTLRHGRPKDWDKNHVLFNGAYDKRKVELKGLGKWPILDYLK